MPQSPPFVLLGARSRAAAAAVVLALVVAGCSLGHRSVAEFRGEVAIPPGVERVRIEVQEGTVGIDIQEAANLTFAGGVRRAGDTAEELAALERIPLEVSSALDPADPKTLIVRFPHPAEGQIGVFGLELGLRLPAALALDVRIAGSGHFTTANRTGAVAIETRRGDLRFERCQSSIRARTGRGNVIVNNHIGDLDVRAGVGDMQVFCRQPGTQLRLSTGEGTIQCYVPSDTDFELDARSETGRVGTSFGIPVESSGFHAAAVGRHGPTGRVKIALSTGQGYVSLQSKSWDR